MVVPERDAEEIKKRREDLDSDLKPRSPLGRVLLGRLALLSVRMERAGEFETTAIARQVRHAFDAYDENRIQQAEAIFVSLHENPRNNLRKLRKSPEGVECLIEAWTDLRADLTADPKPVWTAAHLEQAAHLMGIRTLHMRSSRLGALSRGVWGDFGGLAEADGGSLEESARQKWAISTLLELIDDEIAGLDSHYESLDFETIDRDRLDAPSLALFDTSKDATLARRYESEASRLFFKTLKEFREAEAEFGARPEASPLLLPRPLPVSSPPSPEPKLASFRDLPSEEEIDEAMKLADVLFAEKLTSLGLENLTSSFLRPPRSTA